MAWSIPTRLQPAPRGPKQRPLPARVPGPDPTAVDRPVVSVTTAPSGFEGEGFPVRRAFAGVDLRALDPFVHMDQMGEVDYAPGEPKGTPWHPHRGVDDRGSRLANMAAQVVTLPACSPSSLRLPATRRRRS
jgi:hypothetical protein